MINFKTCHFFLDNIIWNEPKSMSQASYNGVDHNLSCLCLIHFDAIQWISFHHSVVFCQLTEFSL